MLLAYSSSLSTLAQTQKQLETIEQQLKSDQGRATELEKRSANLVAELTDLRRQSIAIAQRTQESEGLLSQLEKKLVELREDVIRRESLLNLRRRQLSGTLGALERLSLNPPRLLLVGPEKPIVIIRSAILLRSALPQLLSDAETLHNEIASLERVKSDMRKQTAKLALISDALLAERTLLIPVMQRKAALQKQTEIEGRLIARKIEKLAGQAQSLRDLMASLGTTERESSQLPDKAKRSTTPSANVLLIQPEGIRPFPKNGSIVLPAQGRIERYYGEGDGIGNASRGITISTRKQAQIISPHDGKIVFAGSFRRYGQILIIEHGGGYHTVLAGLAQIDCVVGQWLLAGEPVGSMGGSVIEQTALYVELRRNGQPINPLRWMMADR